MSESSFILLASTSTGEDRPLSPVKRAKVEFISAVELHAINIDSLCNCCYRDPQIVLSDSKSSFSHPTFK